MAKNPKLREQYRRFARLAKDPRTRASIPTEKLKGFAGADEYRAERAKNARLDSPFVVGGSMTQREAARQRNAEVDLRYRGPENELRQQVADSQRFETQNLPGWYADYQRILRDAQQQTAANTQAALGQVTQLQGLEGNVLAGQAQINAQQQADAAQRGAVADTAGASDVAQRASMARQALTAGFGAQLATQGANNRQRLIDAVPIAQRELGEQQAAERGRRKTLTNKQFELASDRGDYATKVAQDIRDSESKSVLERAAFGLDEAKLAADIQAKKEAAAAKGEEVNEYGYTKDAWRKLSTARRREIIAQSKRKAAAPKDPKYGIDADVWQGMSPEERIKAKKRWESNGGSKKAGGDPDKEPASSLNMRRSVLDRADGFLPKYAKDRGLQLNQSNRARIVADLRKSHPGYFNGVQEIVLSAALDRAILGRISNANLRKLRSRGVYVTSSGEYWGGGNR